VLNKNVGETSENLVQKVRNMRQNGMTALGPGLTISTGMASEGSTGS